MGQVEAESLQVWPDITRSEPPGELNRNEDSWALAPHLLTGKAKINTHKNPSKTVVLRAVIQAKIMFKKTLC